MSRKVAVFGAGGHGKVVADVAVSAGLELVSFIDDATSKAGARIWDVPILRWDEFASEPKSRETAIALGVGENIARERIGDRVRAGSFRLATLVHPGAVVARSAKLGAGTVVIAGAVVNPDAVLGDGCIVNTGAIVEHDCLIGPFAHLSPNVALGGGVEIGARTHLGLGAVALPLVRIGADVRVGAGAVVNRDWPDGVTVVGVPARRVQRKQK